MCVYTHTYREKKKNTRVAIAVTNVDERRMKTQQ
jgi:hypothetical protein